MCRDTPSLLRLPLYTREFTDISPIEALYSQPSVDPVMVALKALLVLFIISGAIAAGAVYSIYQDDYFKIDMRLVGASLDGDDVLVDVQLMMENQGDVDILLQRVSVMVMSLDKTTVFVREVLVPPQVLIPAHGSANLLVQGVRITNIATLETSVMVIVDASWMSGADNFEIHVERPLDVGSL